MSEKQRASEELGKHLRRERERCSMTQKELAEMIGVTEMTIYRWESGESKPRPYAQRKLMKVLHLKRDTFLAQQELQPTLQEAPIISLSTRQNSIILPPSPITRIYRGWRTGTFLPQIPGRNAPSFLEKEEYGNIQVTINDYPLDCYYVHEEPVGSPCFDWGRVTARSEQLAVSILADYFGEVGPRGMNDAGDYQSVKYLFQFWVKVVAFLPYEKWELSSDQITGWLEREMVKRQMESSK